MQKVILASPIFPSGVAWLLNFFLEIEILIYRGNSPQDTWTEKKGHHLLKPGESGLKLWLPILQTKETFSFKDNLSICWLHDFPKMGDIQHKVVLFTRDGRDAIYSYYKRMPFYDNLEQMLQDRILPLNIPAPDHWAIYNSVWSQFPSPSNLLIIRFEDIKTNPLPVLESLLSFLNIQRSEKQLLTAIENSSFEKAKQAEQKHRQTIKFIEKNVVNRKGQPREWLETYREKELTYFNGFPSFLLKKLGYEWDPKPPLGIGSPHPSSLTQVLNTGYERIAENWLATLVPTSQSSALSKDLRKILKKAITQIGPTPWILEMMILEFSRRKEIEFKNSILDLLKTYTYLTSRDKVAVWLIWLRERKLSAIISDLPLYDLYIWLRIKYRKYLQKLQFVFFQLTRRVSTSKS